jgi:geranylgeranyl diphosphate synthase type II
MATDEEFLKAYLHDRQNIVEEALLRYLPSQDNIPAEIYKAIHYSVFAGGKRIRPILCLAAVEAVGGDIAQALPVACSLELIHTYSLIHDDLPAMDNDDFRRGKPTSHKAFGEAIAILAGDALLTEAFVLLSRAEKVRLPAERRLSVIQVIAQAAGISGMVGGQTLDLLAEKTKPDMEALRDIHRRKTGALIVAAVKSGAIISGAREDKVGALTDYGMNIGLAFQIADDILNVEGDSMLMGKQTGSDAARGKVTYPSILGLEAARIKLSEHLDAAIQSLAYFDDRALPLRAIASYIINRKS